MSSSTASIPISYASISRLVDFIPFYAYNKNRKAESGVKYMYSLEQDRRSKDYEAEDMDFCVALYDDAINNLDDEDDEDIDIVEFARSLGVNLK